VYMTACDLEKSFTVDDKGSSEYDLTDLNEQLLLLYFIQQT